MEKRDLEMQRYACSFWVTLCQNIYQSPVQNWVFASPESRTNTAVGKKVDLKSLNNFFSKSLFSLTFFQLGSYGQCNISYLVLFSINLFLLRTGAQLSDPQGLHKIRWCLPLYLMKHQPLFLPLFYALAQHSPLLHMSSLFPSSFWNGRRKWQVTKASRRADLGAFPPICCLIASVGLRDGPAL